MTRYDVYGVGNALVDKEFEVEDQFFEEHEIEKGLMTLVAYEQLEFMLGILEQKYGIKTRAGGGSAAPAAPGSGAVHACDLCGAGCAVRSGR